MAKAKGLLIDLDGVVYVGGKALSGAVDAIERARAAGLATCFLTNTTRTPHRALVAKLRSMGLDVAEEEVLTPARAAMRMATENGLAPHLLVHPALAEDFEGVPQEGRPAVVVGDAGDGFTYAALNAAFRILMDSDAPLIALANNRYFREEDGALSLDAGPFVAALSYAAGREPVVLGKPARPFFEAALANIGCTAAEAVMIGDDVESDVGGAMAAGLTGILVRTGKYRAGAEVRISPGPTYVADDLAAAIDWVLAN